MRCSCCNKNLSDYESTLRHLVTQEFLDTCMKCLDGLDIPYRGQPNASQEAPTDETLEVWSENFDDYWNDEE